MAKRQIDYNEPLIKIENLKKYFPLRKTKLFQKEVLTVKANDGVSLVIHKGETLGLVGESGCGKSTLGRVLLQLYPPTSGKVVYYGYSLEEFAPKYLHKEIVKLTKRQKKHHSLLAEADAEKAKLDMLEQDAAELAKCAEYEKQIAEIQAKNQVIYDECIADCGTFITLNDMKAVNTFTKYDARIAKTEASIQSLDNEIKAVKAVIQNNKENPDTKLVEQIEKLKIERDKAMGKREADLSKDVIVLERKLKAPIVDAEIRLQRLNEQRNDLKYKNKRFVSLVKSSLEHPMLDINSEILVKLVEYKVKHRANEVEIEKLQGLVEHKALKDHIAMCISKAEEIYDQAADTTGAFILSENIKQVEEELFKNIQLKSTLKAEKDNLKAYNVAKYRLGQKKDAHKDDYTEYQLELIDKKIEKENQNIVNQEIKLNELNKAIAASDNFIETLKAKLVGLPLYEELEAKKERGIDLARLRREEQRVLRRDLQIIFQDPYSSLNPRMTVGQIIGEGITAHNLDKLEYDNYQQAVEKVMEKCGLAPYMVHRYPHQFSGGQRQRIGIARALALNPKFVVCDEAVSALDVSIQSQIINLLEDLRDQDNLTYLFISHDLSVIKHISNRIGVMYLGNMVELGDSEAIYQNPLHPYTKALISAIPTTEQGHKKRILLEGDIPSNVFPPSGCKFRTRCPIACSACAKKVPEFREVEPGRFVACHFYEKTKDIQPNE